MGWRWGMEAVGIGNIGLDGLAEWWLGVEVGRQV